LLCHCCRSEGKEFCEHFAEIFTVMDPRDFADVFSVRMGVLYDAMCADPDALTVAAHLVQSTSVGRTFNALLAEYLTQQKLQLLADPAHKVCREGLLQHSQTAVLLHIAVWQSLGHCTAQ
jgi:hypothetical protein